MDYRLISAGLLSNQKRNIGLADNPGDAINKTGLSLVDIMVFPAAAYTTVPHTALLTALMTGNFPGRCRQRPGRWPAITGQFRFYDRLPGIIPEQPEKGAAVFSSLFGHGSSPDILRRF